MIYLEASWFGREGPYAGFAATDSILRALAGLVKLVGPVEGPPLHAPDFQTGILGGLWGFIATASSAVARLHGGTGRSWSLNIFESCLALSEYLIVEAFVRGDVMRRIGVNRFWPNFPSGIYETKKGWLGVTTVAPAQWHAFCNMLGLSELRDDPALVLGEDRLHHMEQIERQFMPRLKDADSAGMVCGGTETQDSDRASTRNIRSASGRGEKGTRRNRSHPAWQRGGPDGWFDAAADLDAAASGRQGASSRRAAGFCGYPKTAEGRGVGVIGPHQCRRAAATAGNSCHRFHDGLGRSIVYAHPGRSRCGRHQDRGHPISRLVSRR
ncbi:CoA transferase [Bradyrhizobium sp. JR3.5]